MGLELCIEGMRLDGTRAHKRNNNNKKAADHLPSSPFPSLVLLVLLLLLFPVPLLFFALSICPLRGCPCSLYHARECVDHTTVASIWSVLW